MVPSYNRPRETSRRCLANAAESKTSERVSRPRSVSGSMHSDTAVLPGFLPGERVLEHGLLLRDECQFHGNVAYNNDCRTGDHMVSPSRTRKPSSNITSAFSCLSC